MADELKAKTLRDHIWDYPEVFSRFLRLTKPLGYILIFVVLAVVLFLFSTQDFVIRSFNNDENSNKIVLASVGELKSLNPIFLSRNNVDRDIFELIYEKLIFIDKDGSPIANIAESWEVKDENKIYILRIKKGLKWNDGEDLDVEDVIFTIQKAIDVANAGVYDTVGTSLHGIEIEKLDTRTVKLTLDQSNPTLFENLSIYILPEHILSDYSLDDLLNYGLAGFPIGSGPYKVQFIREDKIILVANEFYPEKVKTEFIDYNLYSDNDLLVADFKNNYIDVISNVNPPDYEFINEYENFEIMSIKQMNRKKVLFFNMNDDELKNDSLRQAIRHLIDKERLMSEIEIGADIVDSPYSEDSWAYVEDIDHYEFDLEKAEEKLSNAGYEKNLNGLYVKEEEPLEIQLCYMGSMQNKAVVDSVKGMLERNGISVTKDERTITSLMNEVLARRKYEMILLEIETTIDPDQYNLWHSSKADYPNLNISGYSSTPVDFRLERARTINDRNERRDDYVVFQRYLALDLPAVFLFQPQYYYVVNTKIDMPIQENIVFPYQRLSSVEDWSK